jgi:hypothetical protein
MKLWRLTASASTFETADMLAHEVLSRPMRDRKAGRANAGLTGAADACNRATPEGILLPPNLLAELQHDIQHLRFVLVRSGGSRKLAGNDWSRSLRLRLTPWSGC